MEETRRKRAPREPQEDFRGFFEGYLSANDIPQKAVAAAAGKDEAAFSKLKRQAISPRQAFLLGVATHAAISRTSSLTRTLGCAKKATSLG